MVSKTAEAIKEILAEHDPSSIALANSLLGSAEEMTQLIKQVSFVARASANPLPKTTVHMAEPVFAALQRLESRILKHGAAVKEPQEWPVLPGVMSMARNDLVAFAVECPEARRAKPPY